MFHRMGIENWTGKERIYLISITGQVVAVRAHVSVHSAWLAGGRRGALDSMSALQIPWKKEKLGHRSYHPRYAVFRNNVWTLVSNDFSQC